MVRMQMKHITGAWQWAWVGLAALLLALPTRALAEALIHPPTGIALPLEIAGFKRQKEVLDYEKIQPWAGDELYLLCASPRRWADGDRVHLHVASARPTR